MKDFDLPALEYCSLERASRLLMCEVEDILHWAELSAIPLMLKFTHKVECYATIEFSDSVNLYESLRRINPGAGEFLPSILSSFSLLSNDYDDYENEGVINPVHNMIFYELTCRIGGFWEMVNFSMDGEYVNLYHLKPFRNKCEWIEGATYTGGSDFLVSDLYISRESIEVISGAKQRVLFSKANYENNSKPIKLIEDENQKTKNYRAIFIKSLLYVCYGKEAAENPRKFLDNPRSKIRIDFEKEGIPLPSGRSIDNWLKGIDIDTR
ncbi:hypothetical protein J5047_005000 [Salmonella enterica]|nr:hypothetical protein [Salmonella enterica subsp. enterica serovar Adelaide]EHG7930075.1 hypothetical protein [Salmonella enterica]EHG7994517.1 hypothetical protein [Salmonella enterica]EHG8086316.1 hypothetical protein [Salmonella enterica]EHG8100708.1 hypothetical protein [Salmonella enterica]